MRHFFGSYTLPRLTYHRPRSLEEALILARDYGGKCRLVAGCTDVIPAFRRGDMTMPDGVHLVDLKGIEDLKMIKRLGSRIAIGAAASFTMISRSPLVLEHAPLLAQAVGDIGSLQVRNAGTIGGNLCTASPGADTAPPLLALDAEIEIKGSGTERTMPLTDFFLGPGQTKLNPDEILTEVQIPAMGSGEKHYWMKIGRRKSFTLSVISIAIRAKIHDGIFEAVRIALGVVSPTPIRIGRAEDFLVGKECSSRVIEEAGKIVAKEVCPRSSFRASAEYRRDMAQVLTKRGLTSCIG